MPPLVLSGLITFAITFVAFFCANHFWGIIKDKDGNKSVKLSLLCAFVAAVVSAVVGSLVTHLF